MFKNLPTLSTNRRDNRPSINVVEYQQPTTKRPTPTKFVNLPSKSNDANSQVTEPTLDALNIQYNTIIRQETTSINTPTLDGNINDEFIQTSTAAATKDKPETSTTTTALRTTTAVTKSTTLTSSTTSLTSSITTLPSSPTTVKLFSSSPEPTATQSLFLKAQIQNNNLTLVPERRDTDSTKNGDSLVTQSDGQEIEGEVKQISRDQKIDDTSAWSATTTQASGKILSDHLVSAVQGGITNQVAGVEERE